jgi:hypothetical protein
MNRAGLLELLAASGLPEGVKKYLALSAGPSQLRRSLKADAAGTLAGLERLLGEAAGILGLRADAVLFVTGFDGNNLAGDRLDAALAELRAAVFLRGEGFSGLALVERARGRTADLCGARNGREYAFEVCRVRGESFGSGAARAGALREKYAAKKAQLSAYCKRSGCLPGGVILVTGPAEFTELAPDAALGALAAAVLGPGPGPGLPPLCLLCRGGAAVYPAWPRRAAGPGTLGQMTPAA